MQIAIMKSLDEHIDLYSEDSTMGRLLHDCKRMLQNQADDLHGKAVLIKGLQGSEALRIEQLKAARAELDKIKIAKKNRIPKKSKAKV